MKISLESKVPDSFFIFCYILFWFNSLLWNIHMNVFIHQIQWRSNSPL